MKSKFSVNEMITKSIVKSLNSLSKNDYMSPWMPAEMPFNPFTKNVYSGVNQFLLSLKTIDREYSTNRWLTFNNVKKLNGSVKGQKGSEVVYYSFSYFLKGNKISEKVYKNLKSSTNKTDDELNITKSSILKYFIVFNIDQVTGLDQSLYEVSLRNDICPNIDADDLISFIPADIKLQYQNKACYYPKKDSILMPLKEQFKDDDHFYKTLFHELGHWTGHSTRLNRNLTGTFGSKEYAFEELVAELTAAFMCQKAGITSTLLSSSEYVKNWIQVFKDDSSFVFKASALASKAFSNLTSYSSVDKGVIAA